MARNRVIYQSQALFIAPSSTGCQVSGTGTSSPNFGPTFSGALVGGTSLLKKLDRVQSCNFNFTINRQDINEFGKLARLDSIVMESPTVGLDFSYYVTDGLNERLMGFNMFSTGDATNTNAAGQSISGLLSDLQGNNYYILTVQEGEDVVGSNSSTTPANTNTIVGIGNGFISEYSFDASVGAIPTASVTVEAFNIKADSLVGQANGVITGTSPAIDILSSPAVKFTGTGNAYMLSGAFTTGVSNVTTATKTNFTIQLNDYNGSGKVRYGISGALLSSETYSENLGDNQTVDLTFNLQLGGANDTENGVFMSGSYHPDAIVKEFYKLGTGKLN